MKITKKSESIQVTELEQDHVLFQSIMNEFTSPIILLNQDLTIIYANRAFMQDLGYDSEDVLMKSFKEVLCSEQVTDIVQKLSSLIQGNESYFNIELRLHKAENNWDIYDTSVKSLLNQMQQIILVLNLRCITNIKREIEISREKESRYQTLVEQAGESFFVHDFEGKFVEVNQHACDSLGYTKEELLSLSVTTVEKDFDLKKAQVEWAKMEPKNPFTLYGHQQRKNREIFPVEVRFGCFLWNGKRLFMGLARDISERIKAEKELLEKDVFNKRIMDNLPIGIAVNSVLPAVDFVYMNDLFPTYYRTTREELAESDSFWNVVYEDPDFREKIKEKVLNDISSGDPNRLFWEDVPISRKGKEIKYISAYSTPVPGQNLIISTVVDVTERKVAEDKLRTTQSLLNKSQELSKVGGWEYDINTKQMSWTDEVYRIYGVSKSYDTNNINQNIMFYNQRDQKTISEAFQRVIEYGESYNIELKFKKLNGDTIWVRSLGQAEFEDGKVVRVLGYIMDITAPRKVGESLQKKTALLLALHEIDIAIMKNHETPEVIIETALNHLCNLYQTAVVHIGIYDYDERVVNVFELGYNNSTVQQTVTNLLETDYEELMLLSSSKLDLSNIVNGELQPIIGTRFLRLNDTCSTFSVPLITAEKLNGIISISYLDFHKFESDEIEIVQEIGTQVALGIEKTHLQKLQKLYSVELEQRVSDRTTQLEAAYKELEAFSYSVSHDLRAPLRAVDGYVRILIEDYGSHLDDEGKRICSVISNSAKQMGVLIDDLLALSRIGRISIQPMNVDMGAIVKSVFYEMTTETERSKIHFDVGTLPSVNADHNLIRQVWVNLIGNAIKFSSKKENIIIEISAKQQGEEIVYSIKDYGAGFDMQYSNKLFGAFQRLHSTKEFEGTGIGLAIVQRIIHRHGGSIWAEGEVDQGATFYFNLK